MDVNRILHNVLISIEILMSVHVCVCAHKVSEPQSTTVQAEKKRRCHETTLWITLSSMQEHKSSQISEAVLPVR